MDVNWRDRVGNAGLEQCRKFFARHGCQVVRVTWCDMYGLARGKRLSCRHFEDELQAGITFSSAALLMDLRGEVVDGGADAAQGWPNVFAVPRPETLRCVAHEDATAQVIADLYDTRGDAILQCPRTVLQRVLDRAAAAGYHIRIGLELEFYLLSDGRDPLVTPGKRVYRFLGNAEEQRFLGDLHATLMSADFEFEATMAEDGPGQFELVLAQGPALAQADCAFLATNLVKEIAAAAGLTATFLSKPLTGESGCGLHVHISVDDADGRSLFSETSHEILRHFVGGLVRHLPEAAALYLPTVNSYRRLLTRGAAAMAATWGDDNRTAAVRTVSSAERGPHVENRVPAGEANPYLAIAAAVATGLAGVAHRLDPPEPVTGNAFALAASGLALPTGLREAVHALNCSAVLRDWLGDAVIGRFVAHKTDEVERFERHVTDWERDEYLPYL